MGYYGYGCKKMISMRIDEELLAKTKKKIEEENKGKSWYSQKTFTEVVEDALKEYIEKPVKKK